MSLKVKYDSQVDVLYLTKEGPEEKVVEIYPGVNLEMDADGELIGVEILQTSKMLNEVIGSLMQKVADEKLNSP
jgi:uncharacterized protein YuzE